MAEPSFKTLQRDFAAHIRDPSRPVPASIESRRMAIYRELFYNNIESFLSTGFPVLRSIVDDQRWHQLARDFMKHHAAQSPYFVDIPAEFLRFLSDRPASWDDMAGFVLELAHYEYMEVAVGTSRETIPDAGYKADGDLLAAAPLLSPLTCLLQYQWPVQRIGPGYLPEAPLDEPVWLMVYRDRADDVHFMELNRVTARLLQLLEEQPLWSGRRVLEHLAGELGAEKETLLEFGASTLNQLREKDILLGTRLADVSQLED